MEFTKDNPLYSRHDIGAFTYGTPTVFEWGEGAKLTIGKFCSIADGVTLLLGGNHRHDWVTTYPFNVILEEYHDLKGHPATKGNITIGNDVWIGLGATVLSGVTIGDGAVIGARTVVSKDVEPYTIVVGNPGRVVRKRFDPAVIDKLVTLKWWDWDIQKIKLNIPTMLTSAVAEFAEKHACPERPDS